MKFEEVEYNNHAMKKTETKKILFSQLKPFFASKGFKLVIPKFSGFVKQFEGGMDWVYFDTNDYNPCQNVYYSVMKRINSIDDIWQEIDKKYFNTERLNIEFASTLNFSYETINGLNQSRYLPDILLETDIKINTELILQFMNSNAIPLLERFNNIREIDTEINGEVFWESDWRKPYQIGSFAFHRLIVAYLSGNKNFEKLYNYHVGLFDYNNKDFPVKIINGKNSIEYLKHVLEKSGKWNSA